MHDRGIYMKYLQIYQHNANRYTCVHICLRPPNLLHFQDAGLFVHCKMLPGFHNKLLYYHFTGLNCNNHNTVI